MSSKPTSSQSMNQRFADWVYWGNMAGALLAICGLVLSFGSRWSALATDRVLTTILSGGSLEQVWSAADRVRPSGQWYWTQGLNAESLAMFGLMLGVYSVHLALFLILPQAIRDKQLSLLMFALTMNGFILPWLLW